MIEDGFKQRAPAKEKPPQPLTVYKIVEDEKSYSPDEPLKGKMNVIVHARYRFFRGTNTCDIFQLRKRIGGFTYSLSLIENPHHSGHFSLVMKTDSHVFAVTNLSQEDTEELFRIRASFVESLTDYNAGQIRVIESSAVHAPYTAEEIDTCIEAILAHADNTYTKQQLKRFAQEQYSDRIFDAYHTLYNERFPIRHTQKKSRIGRDTRVDVSHTRSILFRVKFRKYLKHWKVEDVGPSTFRLVRKP